MIHLTATEGYKLTQSDDTIDLKDRVFAQQLYGPDGTESNWKEITIAEAEVLEKEQRELFENEAKGGV